MHTKLEVLDESLRGKLRLYALLAPHLARRGAGNFGWCSEIGGNDLLHAEREGVHLVMGCSAGSRGDPSAMSAPATAGRT